MTLAEQALQFAIAEIGVHEDAAHTNRGQRVEQYLASVGLGPGYAWCMAFCYWCFVNAQQKLARTIPLPLLKTGGTMFQYKSRKTRFGVMDPRPGDLAFWDHGKGTGHVAFVEHVDLKNDCITTVEGNTNDEGSREGFEVCRRVRPMSGVLGYLRFE